MKFLNRATLRGWIPAGAVAAILALSALAPTPTLGSTDAVGYGYMHNCGVKGDGTHDHGKLCPNRPFPGQGIGLHKFLSIVPGATNLGGKTNKKSNAEATPSLTVTTGDSVVAEDSQSAPAGHGKSHGHGHGSGHAKS